ncbi:MAG: hypothetical protein DI597_00780 [Pseudoxanthomonas spadix]|nr:MAG: hypothetical protein DI597_00780 [Pseudoxanthomonas spadix]
MAAAKKTTKAATSVVKKREIVEGSYRVLSPVRINKQDFEVGDVLTDLDEKQSAELVELKVIEQLEAESNTGTGEK